MTGLRTYLRRSQEEPADQHILEGALGDLVFRPWFDWIALRSIAHAYFPLSRAWAAAQEAQGLVEHFSQLVSTGPMPDVGVRWMLDLVERRRQRYAAAEDHWRLGFFGREPLAQERLSDLEAERRAAAHDHMATRSVFLPLLGRLPSIRWDVATPAVVEARHGRRLIDRSAAFPASDAVPMEVSQTMASTTARDFWLRFPSPTLTDTAWARVSEPIGIADPPTLVFLHGICVEADMWRDTTDPLNTGALSGFRVVRPEAPWHSRRRRDGWYGGEPAIGQGPLGFIDLFQAWVTEASAWIGWARRTSRGPVALGGVSLGALTSQLAAVAAHGWPADLRPDALFLVATSGAILDVVDAGSLSKAVGLQPQLEAAGWSDDELRRWLPLLEPRGAPALDAEKVVMLLGESDDLTPHAGGARLAQDWAVPAENLFVRPQGHFSVSLGLLRDPAPLIRLAEIMEDHR